DDRLPPRRLHVDDRRFTSDGDRFLERADLQFSVDVERGCAGELDTFTPDGAEPGQCERHRVGTGTQVLDSILTGRVSDRAADLFNQLGARRLDGHAWQYRTRRISYATGDRGLRLRVAKGGNDEHAAQQCADSQGRHQKTPP